MSSPTGILRALEAKGHDGSKPTRYYTRKKQVPVGQELRFRAGHGYYAGGAKPAVKPVPSDAELAVRAQLAPLLAAADAQEKARKQQSSLDSYQAQQQTLAYMRELSGQAGAAQGDYNQAAQVTGQLAGNAADLLKSANPNASIQAGLQAIGAPAAQQTAIANQNQANFGGAAGALFAGQGAVPGDALAAQGLAAATFLRGLTGVQAGLGERSQAARAAADREAFAKYQADRAGIQAKGPELQQAYNQAAAANYYKSQQLELEKNALGLKTAKALNIDPVTGQPLPVKPNASLSRVYGRVVDANGNTIPDANGNPIPVAKTPTKPGKTQTEKNAAAHNTAVKNKGNAIAAYKRQVLGVPTTVSKKVTTGQGLLQTTTTVKTHRQYNAILQQVMGLPEVQLLTDRFNLTPAQVRAIAVKALASKGVRRPAQKPKKPKKGRGDLGYGDPPGSNANYPGLGP